MSRLRLQLCGVLVATLALLGSARADDDSDLRVDRLTFSITLSDGNAYSVVGYLYRHTGHINHGHVLQVALHGASYNHRYWDGVTMARTDATGKGAYSGNDNDRMPPELGRSLFLISSGG